MSGKFKHGIWFFVAAIIWGVFLVAAWTRFQHAYFFDFKRASKGITTA